jgi:hypothetical protein
VRGTFLSRASRAGNLSVVRHYGIQPKNFPVAKGNPKRERKRASKVSSLFSKQLNQTAIKNT